MTIILLSAILVVIKLYGILFIEINRKFQKVYSFTLVKRNKIRLGLFYYFYMYSLIW